MPIVPLSHLTSQPLEWLWPGRLPLGHRVLLDGDPGVGKSILTLDLCARITTGRHFPDSALPCSPANVIIFNAEDNARETIQPRLAAANADVARISVWQHNPGDPWLRLPGDLAQLDSALTRLCPRLLVLDPFTAFLAAGNLAGENEARQALAPLADLAAKHSCCMLLIRHLNKSAGQHALYRGLHSIGLVAACRLAWLLGRDPRLPSRLVLAEEKSNLSVPQPSLAFKLATHPSGHPIIDWEGLTPAKADDLLAATRTDRLLGRVNELPTAFLKDGPRPVSEVTAYLRQHAVSVATYRRSKKDLKITSRLVGTYHHHRRYLLLPGQSIDHLLSPEQKQMNETLNRLVEAHERSRQPTTAPQT